jgi:signal peptidase I
VVTFSSPEDGTRLIKRIVALPGDTVEMRNERLIINGQPAAYAPLGQQFETVGEASMPSVRLAEAVAGNRREIQVLPQIDALRSFSPMVVPPDRFLMLGDNRDNSRDSRYIGLVPRQLLIGRAERVLVSADIKGNWMPRTERFGMRLN